MYVYLNTKMDLPSGRETVLHFFDRLRKTYPQMTDFDCRENGNFVLEEDREQGSYRWVTLETKRFCSGFVNPTTVDAADAHHERVLEVSPFHLDFSPLDCEAMDVLFAFDFTFTGNHDEVVAEALGVNTTLESLLQMPGSRVLDGRWGIEHIAIAIPRGRESAMEYLRGFVEHVRASGLLAEAIKRVGLRGILETP